MVAQPETSGAWERLYTVEMLPITVLKLDHSYQRPVSMTFVRKLEREWSRAIAGAIQVCQRPDGSYYIVDGQHRYEAAKLVGEVEMDVHLYQFPNVQVEASMFRHWNTDVRKPSSLDRFRAAIREGDAGALTIERIVEEAGFTLIYDGTQGRTPNAVGSVDVLYDVYTGPGGEARLSKILRLAKRTWPTKGGAASRVLIMALDAWLRRYDGRYDDARFVRVVGTHDETRDPRRLLANSTTRRDLGGVSAYNAALLALWTAYNYKLRTKRLPHPFGEPEAEAKP